ncbi:MAG: hypothetical protein QG652_755 [Pseudomonadota bacterium]|nr:hypothetical protein [Pseudomonadota bacterium]
MKKLVAVLNGESQIEFERSRPLSERQQEYLAAMDKKMDERMVQETGNVSVPDLQQKAQFVANQLIAAIKSGNEQLAAATLSWLATRLPELQQVSADDKNGQIIIRFIYDKPYIKAQPLTFVKRNG